MGRSGGGGGGGHSGGSHSSFSSGSHSHSSFSSSRSSGGSSYRSSGSYRSSAPRGGYGGGYHSPPPPPPPPRYGYRPRYRYYGGGGYYGRPRRAGCLSSVIAMVFTLVLIGMLMIFYLASGNGTSSIPKSTVNRERLDAGSFTTNCVDNYILWVDEDGFNESRLGKRLQDFWDDTGIQPYIIPLPESSEYDTADERFNYSDELFTETLDGREDMLLLVYFDDEPDGNFEMVCGTMVDTVMDDEAKEIFWAYLNRYWTDVDHYSVQDALEMAFNESAERIMKKTTTFWDVVKVNAWIGLIIVAGVVIVVIMKTRRKHKAEEAAETQRILETPLDKSVDDELVDKYSSNDNTP